MKILERHLLEKHLKEHRLPCISALLFDDSFERKEIARQMIGALEFKEFYGKELSKDIIKGELDTCSLFAEQRVVMIEHSEDLDSSSLEVVKEYLKKPNPSVLLILLFERSLAKHKPLLTEVAKEGIFFEPPSLKPWEKEASYEKWMQYTVFKKKKKIDPQACYLLFHQIGEDKCLIFQELEKLIVYIGERDSIQRSDVEAISVHLNLENAWKLGDAILQKKRRKALSLVHVLLKEGTQPLALLAQLRHQLHAAWHAFSIFETTKQPEAVAKKYPYLKGRRFQKTIEQARGYGEVKFKKALIALHRLEGKLKQEVKDNLFVFDQLLITIT